MWLSCPIGASFGGENSCSVFFSANNNIKILKPKIDRIESYYHSIVQFELDITQLHLADLCDNIVVQEVGSERKTYLEMIKAYFSSNSRTEISKLIGTLDIEKISNLSITDNYSENNHIHNTPPTSNVFDTTLTDKIISSDYEGAMFDCLNANRFVDAIIISDCGGSELRNKAEEFILKSDGSMYLQIAKSIRLKNFDDFVSKSPLQHWRIILEVICKHVETDSFVRLLKNLSDRLIEEGLHKFACFSLILSGDFENFLEIVFRRSHVLDLSSKSITELLDDLVFDYKILRIFEVNQPGLIKSFKSTSNQITVFEILTKLKSKSRSQAVAAALNKGIIDRL